LRKLIAQTGTLAELAPSTDNFLSKDHKAIAESLFGIGYSETPKEKNL
jgi:hypothetical protein